MYQTKMSVRPVASARLGIAAGGLRHLCLPVLIPRSVPPCMILERDPVSPRPDAPRAHADETRKRDSRHLRVIRLRHFALGRHHSALSSCLMGEWQRSSGNLGASEGIQRRKGSSHEGQHIDDWCGDPGADCRSCLRRHCRGDRSVGRRRNHRRTCCCRHRDRHRAPLPFHLQAKGRIPAGIGARRQCSSVRHRGFVSDVRDRLQSACSAAATVCCSSTAMVIGPTPPGTGVIRLARALAPEKSTSPMLPGL